MCVCVSVCVDFMEVMKCEHERAVHLFVDSLMDKEQVSFAYQCTGPERFNKGICLSCRKNRCNHVGYNARSVRSRRNSKMYLKTRADTPFAGECHLHCCSAAYTCIKHLTNSCVC